MRSIKLCGAKWLLILFVGAIRGQEPPQATLQHGAFAFPDSGGTLLLTTSALMQPAVLHTAVCSDGSRVPVQFERRQADRDGHNGRQTSSNFDKLAGDVYKILRGKIDTSARCFLISDFLLSSATVLAPERPDRSSQCGAGVQRRFASSRNREVANCWPIAQFQEDKRIALVEFVRREKDALAAVAFIDHDRMIFADYPRVFHGEGQTLWRADDDGILRPEGFQVVFLLQRGDFCVLGLNWSAAEGDSLAVYVSNGGSRFAEVIRDYWYRAPL